MLGKRERDLGAAAAANTGARLGGPSDAGCSVYWCLVVEMLDCVQDRMIECVCFLVEELNCFLSGVCCGCCVVSASTATRHATSLLLCGSSGVRRLLEVTAICVQLAFLISS